MHALGVICGLGGTALASALPALVERSGSEPCAIASSSYLTVLYFGDPRVIIPASIAADCIRSVPLNEQLDLELVDYLLPYVEFQSTLGYLKDPPPDYLVPGVDLVKDLLALKEDLASNKYSMQWEFMQDLQNLLTSAADTHLSYTPALFDVFKFVRSDSLVSISEDGIQLPQIYTTREVESAYKKNAKAEPISQIDHVPAAEYLQNLSSSMRYQDPDARYQALFYSQSLGALFYSKQSDVTAFGAGFNYLMGAYVALPDELEITYASGRRRNISNMAIVLQDVLGVNSGEQFQQKFEIPQDGQDTTASTTSSTPTATSVGPAYRTANPGYPTPVTSVPGAWLAGYFLDGRHSDTAVLAIVSFGDLNADFDADPTAELLSVRETLANFLEHCKKAGKKRLVIDLSANSGGDVLQPYEVYGQLFPEASYPWDGFRYQASDAMDFIGQHIYDTAEGDVFFQAELDRQLRRYPDWQALYGPDQFPQANETHLVRMNLTSIGEPGNGPQLFHPQDIVIVSDGACAGACTLLVGLLTREQNVRAIAFGGRPINAPMQAMGGSKGANATNFSSLAAAAAAAASDSSVSGLPNASTPPLNPPLDSMGTFNLRNVYPEHNSHGPPLQFVYEAANCKRFFTAEESRDVSVHWSVAADVAWYGAKCVPGSTVNQDGTMGNEPPAWSQSARVSTQ